MSAKWMLAVTVMLFAAVPAAQKQTAFKDVRERTSYALGVEAGQQFAVRGIDLDADAFAMGIKDVLTGKTPQLTDEQVKSAIAELQATLKRREYEARTGRAEAARNASEAFLAEHAKQDGVVTRPSGLQYKVLVDGTGRTPTDSDTVECVYRATLLDGTEFDSSMRGGSSPFLKVGQAIAGLREALTLMPVGSKWRIVVPPGLATGPRTATMVIPPNEALIYELELVAIK